jgi:putative polyhydroxyalkanoate system protein
MAKIHIERRHDLGLDKAREEVEKLAESLKSELQAAYRWNGNQLLFERTGASGTITLTPDKIDLDVKLSLMLSPMKAKIEDSIRKKLDLALAGGGNSKLS